MKCMSATKKGRQTKTRVSNGNGERVSWMIMEDWNNEENDYLFFNDTGIRVQR